VCESSGERQENIEPCLLSDQLIEVRRGKIVYCFIFVNHQAASFIVVTTNVGDRVLSRGTSFSNFMLDW